MTSNRLRTSLTLLTLFSAAACSGGELDFGVPSGGASGSSATGGAAGAGKGGSPAGGAGGKGGAAGAAGRGGAAGVGVGGQPAGGSAGQAGAPGGSGGQGATGGAAGSAGQGTNLGLDAAPTAATLGTATFGLPLDVVIPAGPFAFGVQSGGGVAVLDLANPAAVKTASTIATPAKVVAVDYDDASGLVYLLDVGGTVTVARLLTAEAPTVLTSLAGLPAAGTAMARVGNRLFVLAGASLQPLTVSFAGATPILTLDAVVTLPNAPSHLAGSGGMLFLGYVTGGVQAWSAPPTGAPAKLGSLELGGAVAALAAKGSKVVAIAKTLGMRVIDFGAPAAPALLWQDADLYDAFAGQVHGRTLVVGLDRKYVSVIDLSDFTHPRAVTTNKGVLPKWVSFVDGNLVFGAGTSATIASVPPFVAARAPALTIASFPQWGAIPLTFNKRVDPATATSITLVCAGAPVKGAAVVAPDSLTIAFRPTSPLPPSASCTLAYGGVKDASGNPASTPSGASLAFTTSSDPPASFMQPHSAYAHTSDGAFTDWKPGATSYEWFDVKPAKGMYTYFYADFDPAASKLWLLNDWFYDGDDIEPDCYNQFQAWTGDGKEQWEIRAYGDRHVEVRKNGVPIDPLVAGVDGGFSYGASPNVPGAHTQYELGIPASAGQWGVQLHDPGPAFQCKKLASEPSSVVGATGMQASSVDPTHQVNAPAVAALASLGTAAALTPTLSWTTTDDWKNFDAYLVTVGSDPQLASGRWTSWVYGSSVTLPVGLLAPGSTYYWRVLAYNGAGQAVSTVGTFTTAGSMGTGGMGGTGGSGGAGAGGVGGAGAGGVSAGGAGAGGVSAGGVSAGGAGTGGTGAGGAGAGGAGAGGAGAGGAGGGGAGGAGGAAGSAGAAGAAVCGSVQFGTAFGVDAFAPSGAAFADFNGDSRLDVVVGGSAASGASAQVFLGNGTGALTPKTSFGLTSNGTSPVTADFNKDGKMDFAVIGSDFAAVVLGNGDGTFGVPSIFTIGTGTSTLATGDVNGDGVPDLVTSASTQNSVVVLLGVGDGTFQAPAAVGVLMGGADSVALGDFNGDGRADVVAHSVSSGTVELFLGAGNGTFAQPAVVSTGSGKFSTVYAGHFDTGATLDILLNIGGFTSVSLGNGDGTFAAAKLFSLPNGVSAFPGDVDGDGVDDLLAPAGNTLMVYRADGTGAFPGIYKHALAQVTASRGAAADLNGDGKLDAVVEDTAGNTIAMVLNSCQ